MHTVAAVDDRCGSGNGLGCASLDRLVNIATIEIRPQASDHANLPSEVKSAAITKTWTYAEKQIRTFRLGTGLKSIQRLFERRNLGWPIAYVAKINTATLPSTFRPSFDRSKENEVRWVEHSCQ
jgi:hypothetical protein